MLNVGVFRLFAAKAPIGESPELTSPLETVEVVEGSQAKLVCRVKGKPEPKVEWFKDDVPVKESKRVQIKYDGEMSTLLFNETEVDDEGEYKCVVRNEFGEVASTAELLVNEVTVKPEFEAKMKPMEVNEGEEARFDVRIKGVPEPIVDWYKGNDKIEDEGRFMIVDDEEAELFSLIIEDTRPEDAGTYKCVAENDEGEAASLAKLTVVEKAKKPVIEEAVMASPVAPVQGMYVLLLWLLVLSKLFL